MPTYIPASDLADVLATLGAHALLDVRERGEYALGHLPGACPLPRGLLEVLAGKLVPWTQVPVVVYCDDGHRSALAAGTLEELGYADVRVIEGGLAAWRALGNTPEEGVNVLGKTYGELVSATGGVQQIEPDRVAELQAAGDVLVIDARTEVEYGRGHIPGAVSIPGGELASTLLSIPEERRAATVVVHCAGRTRSIVGAQLVQALGYPEVYALRNGTMAWRMSGRSVEYEARPFDRRTTAEGAARAAEFADRFVSGQGASVWTADEVIRAREAGRPLYLLDVRQVAEFEAARAHDAINCPVGQLANAADEQLAVRAAEIVCYSGDETRARIGAGLLRRIGYPNVGWLQGGLRAWQRSGHAGGAGRPSSYPEGLAAASSSTLVEATTVRDELADGRVTVVDVRRSSEFALGHIPASVWVPRGDLERRLPAAMGPDTSVVLVSDRGVRAALAESTARALGYPDVRVLAGGFEGWRAAGFPVDEGLDGADVDLREAKEDAELVAPRPRMLERNREDMVRYLTWEEQLGHAFKGADSV
ncbi:rhodanese-like domain-containing protein [Streptomyces antimycoticus]|uniref:rhodanese-like domain-containing protein n=1 Tax=Streptomyces antimycoticus TaxID=68175 RepID=UPI00369F10AD